MGSAHDKPAMGSMANAMDSDYGAPRELSPLQKRRALYQPELPPCIQVLYFSSPPFVCHHRPPRSNPLPSSRGGIAADGSGARDPLCSGSASPQCTPALRYDVSVPWPDDGSISSRGLVRRCLSVPNYFRRFRTRPSSAGALVQQ
jgi:hypothetical protein